MDWSSLVERLGATVTDLAVVVVAAVVIYLWVIAANRLLGLRSFAKLSAFDFAMTVAIGSMIAAIALDNAPLLSGLVAVAALFAIQFVVAKLRQATAFDRVVDNAPVLLVHEGRILDDHLARARLTRDDLMAKLRAANVLDVAEVRAVVFETTGDVSVLSGEGRLDPALLRGVRLGPVAHDPTGEAGT
ncbi:DUF421 domain-containing protein [Egicoccus sp. AB-alg6-2]|uniref:DUF421 domain-containing protein n=1 Tax=Egicoccus sp. AB-alg6-2 TaxID=3242692 RepID=UPI00359D82BB